MILDSVVKKNSPKDKAVVWTTGHLLFVERNDLADP